MREALSGIAGLVFFLAIIVIIVQMFRRKWKSVGIWAGVWLLSVITGVAASSGETQTTSAPASNQIAETPAPSQPKSPSPVDEKRAFLKTVDESISGAAIAGNMYKYVGKHVDLHCAVDDIPQADFFNATCGEDSNGDDVTIVIEANSKSLSPGQSVRVIGTVADPMEGNNAMSGDAHFPTVQAQFME